MEEQGLRPFAWRTLASVAILALALLNSHAHAQHTLTVRSLQSPVNTEWGALVTGSAIATLPQVILFVMSSRQLISGLTTGAVK